MLQNTSLFPYLYLLISLFLCCGICENKISLTTLEPLEAGRKRSEKNYREALARLREREETFWTEFARGRTSTTTQEHEQEVKIENRQKGKGRERERAEAEARERAEAEARERAETETKERAEAEIRERAETEVRERTEAEVRERTEAEVGERAEAETRERAEAEAMERRRATSAREGIQEVWARFRGERARTAERERARAARLRGERARTAERERARAARLQSAREKAQEAEARLAENKYRFITQVLNEIRGNEVDEECYICLESDPKPYKNHCCSCVYHAPCLRAYFEKQLSSRSFVSCPSCEQTWRFL